MARELTGLLIGKANLVDLTNSVPETLELDFELARGQGVQIEAVEFAAEVEVDTQTTAPEEGVCIGTLHAEQDNLETVFFDQTANVFNNDSEILAECAIGLAINEDSTSGHAFYQATFLSPSRWVYRELAGSPIILTQNPTYRGAVEGDLAGNVTVSLLMTVYYKIVTLTDTELLNQFLRRR